MRGRAHGGIALRHIERTLDPQLVAVTGRIRLTAEKRAIIVDPCLHGFQPQVAPNVQGTVHLHVPRAGRTGIVENDVLGVAVFRLARAVSTPFTTCPRCTPSGSTNRSDPDVV